MANLAERLADYGASLHYSSLPPEAARQAKRMIIDTLGCAIGAYASEPSKIAREIAGLTSSSQPATVLGSGQQTSVDLATFANGVMIRYLDYNDGYTSAESGHPSDSIAAALSPGEAAHASGRRVIAATVLAYEVFCRLCDAGAIRTQGFDHTTVGGIASVLAAARVSGLSKEQTVQAINIGVASGLRLYQTRIGDVSMWKGCAYADASRNAVFATMLARRGLTGPSPVFEGTGGYFKAAFHRVPELAPFGGHGQPFKIMECSIKRFPLGQYSQTVVQAALEARAKIPGFDPSQVAAVNIRTLQTAINIMAGDAEKWHPSTRETADHSMPYTVAVALTHNRVSQQHFEEEFWTNPQLLDLTQKVKVTAWDEANRRAPEAMLCDLEIVLQSGQRRTAEVAYHKGHWRNPLSDAEVEEKFRSLAHDLLTPAQIDLLLEKLWRLEEVKDIGEVIRLARI